MLIKGERSLHALNHMQKLRGGAGGEYIADV